MTEDTMTAGMGHNKPPLEDWIFDHEDASVESVFAVLSGRIARDKAARVAELAKAAKALVGNLDRIPDELDDQTARKAYDLLAAIGAHEDRVEEIRQEVAEAAKTTLAALTALCKPVDEGIAKLDKKLRPLLTARLLAKIEAHDAERTEGEPRMTSLTEQGGSGSKATLTVAWKNEVVDAAAVPAAYTTSSPDQKKIDEAVEKGIAVPGVTRRRDPALRISK
jgi:hypothetical protein